MLVHRLLPILLLPLPLMGCSSSSGDPAGTDDVAQSTTDAGDTGAGSTTDSTTGAPDAGPQPDDGPTGDTGDPGDVPGPPDKECPTEIEALEQAKKPIGKIRSAEGPGRHLGTHCGEIVWASPQGGLRVVELVHGKIQVLLPDELDLDVRWPDAHEGIYVFTIGDPPQVRLLDPVLGEVIPEATDAAQKRPRVSGSQVVWEDERDGQSQIRRLDRATGDLSWVDSSDADQRFPALHDDGVVWTDFRDDDENGLWDGDGSDDTDLWASFGDVSGPLVQAAHKQAFAEIQGDRIVWLDWRNVAHDEQGHPRPEPKLKNPFEIWQGEVAGGALADDRPFGVIELATWSALPSIFGDWVAWASGPPEAVRVMGKRWETELAAPATQLTPDGLITDSPLIAPATLAYRNGDTLELTALEQ